MLFSLVMTVTIVAQSFVAMLIAVTVVMVMVTMATMATQFGESVRRGFFALVVVFAA